MRNGLFYVTRGFLAGLGILLTILVVEARTPQEARGDLTDAEIAAVVVTANAADVANGELALARATDPQVKAFAQTMVTDHTAVNRQAAELAARLGVTPTPSEASRSLDAATTSQRQALAEEVGAAFDRTYIANEVAYHATVLETLDTVLIPQAQNAELKGLLVAVRPAFVAHLEHARQLDASLAN